MTQLSSQSPLPVGTQPTARDHPGSEAKGGPVNVVLVADDTLDSVISLITGAEIDNISPYRPTMDWKSYEFPLDDTTFTFFAMVGITEHQMEAKQALDAVRNACRLVETLNAAGGVHLLLFCINAGRVTGKVRSTYQIFCQGLCGSDVPVAVIVTGLERETPMESWWEHNSASLDREGILSNAHACVTVIQGDHSTKYTESQETIRNLVKSCALQYQTAYKPEHSLGRLGGYIMDLTGSTKENRPKKKEVMSILKAECKYDTETADTMARVMLGQGQEEMEVHTSGCCSLFGWKN